MSLSKEQLTVVSAEQPRQPKCTRCRHHGIIVPQKGHVKYCPFLKCDCWKCYLITQRTRITALQRNLKKAQNKEQGAHVHTGVSVVKPAAEEACRTAAAEGGARPSATVRLMRPPPATTPPDPRSRPPAGGENVAGLDRGKVLPLDASEKGPCTPFNGPYFGDFGQTAPLPATHFPFRLSGHYHIRYVLCPNPLLNMLWMPPVPAGLYNDGLRAPLMFPHIPAGPVHYPPPPETGPPADYRQVFFTPQPAPIPEPLQEEPVPRQQPRPPLYKHTERDIEELD